MIDVVIYTDGACSPNPGRGGWGALLIHASGTETELCGGDEQSTNNRQEVFAAIAALEHLDRPHRVRLHTDSRYLRDGITLWMSGWKSRGWRTSSNDPVKNDDLWRRLDSVARRHRVEWVWVRGHSGDPGNERADALARAGRSSGMVETTRREPFNSPRLVP